ncbi:hypothetical protein FOA52_012019 [Chlamydomonas sp. UWO 241]|nr:hypothetical protein FOA52_012019 [Chlamydomonas sp. UWO 241]
MLVFLSFISFLLKPEDLEPRMSVTLTVILTIVALKFTVSQYLPTTSYLTLLDWYVVLAFSLTFAVAGQNALVYYFAEFTTDGIDANMVNAYTGWALVAFWVLVNIMAVVRYTVLIHQDDRYVIVDSYRDCESRPLSSIDSIDRSHFPFPKIVDNSDRLLSKKYWSKAKAAVIAHRMGKWNTKEAALKHGGAQP